MDGGGSSRRRQSRDTVMPLLLSVLPGTLCTTSAGLSKALDAAKPSDSSQPVPSSKIFDVLNIVNDARESGNLKFKDKDFEQAKIAYGSGLDKALAALQGIATDVVFVPGGALLLSNRAACYRYARACAGLVYVTSADICLGDRSPCSELGEAERAIEDATQVLQMNPHYVRARMRRADAYRKAGKLREALADLKELRVAVPGDNEIAANYNAVAGEIGETAQVLARKNCEMRRAFSKEEEYIYVCVCARIRICRKRLGPFTLAARSSTKPLCRTQESPLSISTPTGAGRASRSAL